MSTAPAPPSDRAGHGGRVAVIAIHGVADQAPGETARALVELLVASSPPGTRYLARETEPLTLPVDLLEPRGLTPRRADASPTAQDRGAIKSLAQSLRSDFQREQWSAPTTMPGAIAAAGKPAPDAEVGDRGIAVSNYLLRKHCENGAHREAYATHRTTLERQAGGAAAQVDVFEMYWADLSRLSGALPRIVTELFTMVFRLSKLGRETVDEARSALGQDRNPAAWSAVTYLQIGLDWLFVNGLALLFLQLLLLGGVLVGFGLLDLLPGWLQLPPLLCAGVAATGLLLLAYRYKDRTPRAILPPLVLAAAGLLPLTLLPAALPWATALLMFGAATLASEAGLRIAEERFPLVRLVGRTLWIAALAFVALTVIVQPQPATPTAWLHATLFGTELTLLAIKYLWISIAGLMALWLVAGWFAASRQGYEARASLATGRLGFCLSLSAFLAMTMAIWTLLATPLAASVRGVGYTPCIFERGADRPAFGASAAQQPVLASAQNACLWTSASARTSKVEAVATAEAYLEGRREASTQTFSLVAAVLLGLVAFLLFTFVPSVLAELKILVDRSKSAFRKTAWRRGTAELDPAQARELLQRSAMHARRLGRWLSSGYRSLDGVVHLLFGAGIVFAIGVGLAYLNIVRLPGLEEALLELSRNLLAPLVLGAAGLAVVLVAFGGVLSKYLPSVRGPLDVVLDVDNHFREFPRTSIPRARIFSRYAALLEHVAAGGYAHIVIVAHSQGTVISAELLRFLASANGRSAPAADAVPTVRGTRLDRLSLLTMGCPLRQLYAARFPSLYRWVLQRRAAISGPRAADIGVRRWINAFCSGDYVGRWLWSDHANVDTDPLGHPMSDTVAGSPFGRLDAYSAFDPMPPDASQLIGAREVEVCLGVGAHTHYFDREQSTVAWLIDHLIEGRGVVPQTGA